MLFLLPPAPRAHPPGATFLAAPTYSCTQCLWSLPVGNWSCLAIYALPLPAANSPAPLLQGKTNCVVQFSCHSSPRGQAEAGHPLLPLHMELLPLLHLDAPSCQAPPGRAPLLQQLFTYTQHKPSLPLLLRTST